MKIVTKKILPEYFELVKSGRKTFEIRKDEDCIEAGDTLILKEVNQTNPTEYTGRYVKVKVTYVLRNVPEYGLAENHCIICWNSYVTGFKSK